MLINHKEKDPCTVLTKLMTALNITVTYPTNCYCCMIKTFVMKIFRSIPLIESKMLGKCLWLSAGLVMLAVADQDAVRRLKTAEPGNWTVDNCIVLKMSAQVRGSLVGCSQCFGSASITSGSRVSNIRGSGSWV